jgi:paraquat-inducible protein A
VNVLVWIAHVLLGIGIAAPCMTVTPRLGDHTALGEWLGLVGTPRSYSIMDGIRQLLGGNGIWLGLVVLLFSVLFPIAKLIALRMRSHRLHGFGKYSMVDVFVIALLVVVSKSFPGGTEISVEWGIYPFAAASLLTMLASARVQSSMR